MIIYDGTYRFRKPNKQGDTSISQWRWAWRIRIIDLNLSRPEVRHLKPIVIVASQTDISSCLTSCAESIGKRISRDFNLDVSHVLWVEYFPNKLTNWYVAVFTPKSRFGPDIFYSIHWRPIRPNEIDVIKKYIPEIDDIR